MIQLNEISKIYDLGSYKVTALHNISFRIERGEFITIMGPSGSGKSTILHILGLLDLPSTGDYKLENYSIDSLSDRELSRIRNRHFGFVFQSFNLFHEFNALENVMMPMVYAKMEPELRKKRAKELLDRLGLKERFYHYPNMLSGGEQQRVAIARALANNPTFILADEPTGNLPSKMGAEILSILYQLNDDNVTIVMVTHDDKLGKCGKRILRISDGSIEADEVVTDRYKPGIYMKG